MESRLVATPSVDRKAEEATHGRSANSASAYGVPEHIKVLVDLTTYLHWAENLLGIDRLNLVS